jgi:hypothetical protein
MNIKDLKQQALNEILTAYETYRGAKKSRLSEMLKNLNQCGVLLQSDYDELIFAVDEYKQYIFGILSNSRRVRVQLQQAFDICKPLDDSVFEDLGELEP